MADNIDKHTDINRDRILVVDDSPIIRDMLVEILTDSGFSVDTAEDGEQGIAMALKTDLFDVLHREHPDWYPPVVLQTASYSDSMSTVFHDDYGGMARTLFLDVTSLRGVIQLPLSPEKRLFATAESLPYEEPPSPAPGELYEDVMRMLRPPEGAGKPPRAQDEP